MWSQELQVSNIEEIKQRLVELWQTIKWIKRCDFCVFVFCQVRQKHYLYHLMAYFISNNSANSYKNRLMYVEFTACQLVSVRFGTHLMRHVGLAYTQSELSDKAVVRNNNTVDCKTIIADLAFLLQNGQLRDFCLLLYMPILIKISRFSETFQWDWLLSTCLPCVTNNYRHQ